MIAAAKRNAHIFQFALGMSIKLLSVALASIFHFVLIKTVAPAEYGLASMFLVINVLLLTVVIFGIEQVVVREFSPLNKDELKADYKRLLYDMLKRGLAVILVCLGFSFILSTKSLDMAKWAELVVVAAIVAAFQGIISLHSAVFKSRRFAKLSLLFSGVVTYTLSITLIALGQVQSAFDILSVYLVGTVFSTLLSTIILKRVVIDKGVDSDKSVINFQTFYSSSKVLFWANMTALTAQHLGLLLVGTFVTETAVAMLNVAIKISLFISLPLLVLNTFISPKFAVWFKEDKIEKLQSTYWRIISATVPVSIVIFALVFVLGEQLLHFFGEDYHAAFTALWILCLGQCVNLAFGPVVALLVMTGQERFQRKLMVSLSIATVVTLLIVVPSYGILGAATITAANLVLLNVISFVRLLPVMTK